MGTTVDFNVVLSHVKSKGVNLDEKQKTELESLFHKADKLEHADGELSQKELDYFVSHAGKDLKIGNAVDVTKSAETIRSLIQNIKKIDTQIETLESSKKDLAVKGKIENGVKKGGKIGVIGGAALGFIGGLIADCAESSSAVGLAAAVGSGGSGFLCALGGVAGLVVGLGVGAAVGGIYAYNKYKNSIVAQQEDRTIEMQNRQIDLQIEDLKKQRKSLQAKLAVYY